MTNQSKQILSFLRNGDFAHPGEVEAIDFVMDKISKNKDRKILDIGCGLGGTAHYLQENEFGHVTGIDIDPNLIDYASTKYSDIKFLQCEVMQVVHQLNRKFNLMICMSAFFCFLKQKEALKELSRIADSNCDLIIFDYSKFSSNSIASPFHWSTTASHFSPIYLDEFKQTLLESGWQYQSSIDISAQFAKWYQFLLQKFVLKKEGMLNEFDMDHVNKMESGYYRLLKLIQDKIVGGVVVYAKRP